MPSIVSNLWFDTEALDAAEFCRGSRLPAGRANGCPAFAQHRIDPAGGHAPWALQVLELRADRIAAVHALLDVEAFARFGLPPHLPAG